MSTVIVCGAVANKHRHGGSIWTRMSWAEGLRSLGHEVVFLEQLHEQAAVDRAGQPAAAERSANAEVFETTMAQFHFADASALLGDDCRVLRGIDGRELRERCRDADLLVNISGHLREPGLLALPRLRAFIDLDPGYTQIWCQEGREIGLHGHELHFTVGANVGSPGCPLPSGGVDWRAIRQPVVIARWPALQDPFTRFTTVGSWRGAYGPVQWQGRHYGVKAHEFRPLADLPHRAELPFEIALDMDPADGADFQRMRAGGWRLIDPSTTATTADFGHYVRGSGAEFSAAQGVYVHARTGWCSDRTVRYLASGRPALVQDTGQAEQLPVGAGLLTFSSPEQAAELAREIVADYREHGAAARALAERYFTPAAALAPLIEAAGL
jgi:hypothetical protein